MSRGGVRKDAASGVFRGKVQSDCRGPERERGGGRGHRQRSGSSCAGGRPRRGEEPVTLGLQEGQPAGSPGARQVIGRRGGFARGAAKEPGSNANSSPHAT